MADDGTDRLGKKQGLRVFFFRRALSPYVRHLGAGGFFVLFFVSFSLFLFIPSYHVVSSDLAASSHEAKRPRASLSFPILPSHVCYNFFYDSTVSGTLHENPSILSAHQRSLPVCSIATRFTSTCAELRKVETPTIRRRPA